MMDDWKYAVYGGNMEILADGMTLHDALLFVKALYEDAYAEPGLAFIIRRNPPGVVHEDCERRKERRGAQDAPLKENVNNGKVD